MVTTLSIGAAASMLGVGVNTLRAWRASGFLIPVYRTEGGRRRYDPSDVYRVMLQTDAPEKPLVTVACARVSTHDQKKDLEAQVERLKAETLRWVSSTEAQAYRAQQAELIDQGKYLEAFEKDAADVNKIAQEAGGQTRYDAAIEEARAYAKCREQNQGD